MDARTGRLKWRWDPALVKGGFAEGGARYCCGPVNRGVAIYKGRVYVGLLDGRLVALDAENGRVVWSVQTTPAGTDYSITGAPRIVKGKVVIGNGGGEYGVRGYLTAYDAETGKQAWRWFVVPGDPAKGLEDRSMEVALKTWKGEWWKYGGGGTPWDGIAYDPEANLVYVGTGNGSPWARDHRSPGGGDNLYLSSIVALNADTGRYVWHYQTTPGDDWDYNAAQPMILADLTIGGRPRKVLLQAPKNGFFYVLDRLTGELLSAQPYVTVNWATHIDLKTGRPVETPEARYGAKGARLSPSAVGAHHWPPMAFNPTTGLVYFPGQETSMVYRTSEKFDFQDGQWNTGTTLGGAAGAAAAGATATPPQRKAFFVAWDPVANKERWRIDFNPSGGALSTAGQLDLRRRQRRQVHGARSGHRQDAVGEAAHVRHRYAGHLRDRRHAVRGGDVGHDQRQGLRVQAAVASAALQSCGGQRMRAQVSVPVVRPPSLLIDSFSVLPPSANSK